MVIDHCKKIKPLKVALFFNELIVRKSFKHKIADLLYLYFVYI